MSKKTKGIVIGAVLLAVLIAAAALVFVFTRPETTQGDKTITVQIVYDNVDKSVVIDTDAEYLRGALDEKQLVEGDESEYGLFIKKVDGRAVDDAKQEWWCITKGGESVMSGVETTPIADGDVFEITLKVGYNLTY